MRCLAAALFALVLCSTALASAIETYPFSSELEETRFRSLIAELRCTVCQNQSLSDSDAPLAKDLRREVFGMLQDNRSDQEIRDFMVERYGEFVLYRPPLAGHTLLLWGGPVGLLVIGLATALIAIRKRRTAL
ncbi:MAG TPA: cytochrome c-type biogenesis protein [Wenzhouxiangella sp.]|nr:cytochrome c-type biogenesis protein [Wenzhouxiangella sp.]HLS04768.1 cytochrome c-type biogenesis protein [Wenzhouxiangella sp.]